MLDTHLLIWLQTEPGQISKQALGAIANKDNQRFVSVASYWEMTLKWEKGRLELKANPYEFLNKACQLSKLELLPILERHVTATHTLPDIHVDPFDRLLAGQTIAEQMTLVSSDKILRSYPLSSIW